MMAKQHLYLLLLLLLMLLLLRVNGLFQRLWFTVGARH